MINRAVIGPSGGYANHVRWLALANDFFKVIKNFVYYDKTCFNWIQKESMNRFRYRNIYNLYIDHTIVNAIDKNKTNKIIVLLYDPKECYKAYLKFDPNFSHWKNVKDFLKTQKRQNFENETYELFPPDEKLILNSKDVFTPTLNVNLYKKIIEFFELPYNYEAASEIHNLWYNMHKKAEIDVLKINHGWYYENVNNSKIYKPNEQQMEIIKNRINKTYGDHN